MFDIVGVFIYTKIGNRNLQSQIYLFPFSKSATN
ncbi:hypothetical protein CLU83_1448 [Flavobacterium sp. 1]|nr:hypothetical protein CLU83_1448 [Flavobacterium sp. 1]